MTFAEFREKLPKIGGKGGYLEIWLLAYPAIIMMISHTVMSTIDSYGFLAAVSFGRDIVWRLGGSRGDSGRFSRLGIWVTGLLSLALALWRESIVGLWHDLGSVGTPVLLFPLALSFGRREAHRGWILTAMIAGGGISLAWLIVEKITGSYPLGLRPIFPGLLLSGVFSLIGLLKAPTSRE